ncbi:MULTISPECIES: hypothetical protein [unclassified Mesorhizobium]|uniref:hypothetical protein n=1 Tax=unclassified Mesorhizobium TaxID=325217 RepID=UPI0024172825|nr:MULTISPECIES: hypothetical protein [unclassified Mesorhizobium]MDG4902789.1 hypothetical protein [Mesorhizobium sp. WSM4962]MDG4920798.1 hypothetical protein [Mesorhizobium sp. WSM4989]
MLWIAPAYCQFNCSALDARSDWSKAVELENLAFSYNWNAMNSNDPVEQCDDLNSAVDALKEAYEIFNACRPSSGVKTLGLIRVYNRSRSDYCAEAKKIERDNEPTEEGE